MMSHSYARAPFALVVAVHVALVGGCIEPAAAPQSPQLGPVESPTSSAVQALIGTKQAGTSIEVTVNRGAAVLVKLDDATQWSAVVELAEGTNEIAAVAIDASNRRSSEAVAVILLDTAPPQAPVVDAPRARTLLDALSVTGTVTPGDQVSMNGASLALGSGAASFSVDVDLELGDNVIRVASRDIAGNESAVQEFVVERILVLPFDLDDPPALVNRDNLGGVSLSGTRGDDVEVSVNGDALVDATAPAGAWSVIVPVINGENAFTVTGAFAGEPTTAVSFDVVVQADLVSPLVDVTSPSDGDLLGGTVAIAGTASDAQSTVEVSACVGACIDLAAFEDLALSGGAFAGTIDISAADVDDGQLADVVVRVVDVAGNATLRTTSVLVFRAPIGVAGIAGTTNALDLAPDVVVGGALAWTNTDGAAGATLDEGGDGWTPVDAPLVATGATSPRIARASSITHIVWIENDDLMYASDDGIPHLVTSGVTDAVTSVDVTFDADDVSGDTAFIAFVQGDEVLTMSGAADTWSAPVVVSDAATASAAEVAVARGGVAVAWLETSNRDGLLDDADVVTVARAGGVPSAPDLVSADQGSFVDGASRDLHAAVLSNGEVVLAWIDGTRGVVARVDVDDTPPGIGTPTEVTNVAGHGVASSIFIEADTRGGGNVLVGWLDDGVPLLSSASAPALVVRRGPVASLGAAVVVSRTAPASSPAGFLEGGVAQLAWIEGGDVLLFAMELP